MKKNIISTGICLATLAILTNNANMAWADSLPYEPVFEAVPISESMPATKVEPVKTSVTQVNATQPPSVEADNLQNALVQLDGAQVELRNQLLQYRGEYTEIDNQYKLIKEQRRVLDKQIKSIEKRIKEIERSKSQIRKTMI